MDKRTRHQASLPSLREGPSSSSAAVRNAVGEPRFDRERRTGQKLYSTLCSGHLLGQVTSFKPLICYRCVHVHHAALRQAHDLGTHPCHEPMSLLSNAWSPLSSACV